MRQKKNTNTQTNEKQAKTRKQNETKTQKKKKLKKTNKTKKQKNKKTKKKWNRNMGLEFLKTMICFEKDF